VLSFKSTALFKGGVWLSAAALLAFVIGPAALSGELRSNPLPSAIAVSLVLAAIIYFFWSTQVYRLADEVLDCQDSLRVRSGRVEETIPLSDVSAVDVTSRGGFHRITIRLRRRTKLGRRIEFLPQASLWSNLVAIKALALDLTERAQQARAISDLGVS
jgi:membrane protein YdbS with pleckstrin-like domain